jgi:hypothetical protein
MMGLYLADIILLVAGPIALDKISWKFFLVLIIPTALHIVFVYFMCPETKGRSLEDINAQFGEAVAVKFYGATAEEQAQLEKAALQDEENEVQKARTSFNEHRREMGEKEELGTETKHAEEVANKTV